MGHRDGDVMPLMSASWPTLVFPSIREST
jgi:hypothetical protein